jgi:hypothetical protein
MPFRVPKFLGEFNGKICSECISYNLEFQNFLGENPCTPHLPERGENPPLGLSPTQALPRLVRASGTQLSPYFINWDSYFNSFWEPCNRFELLNFRLVALSILGSWGKLIIYLLAKIVRKSYESVFCKGKYHINNSNQTLYRKAKYEWKNITYHILQ